MGERIVGLNVSKERFLEMECGGVLTQGGGYVSNHASKHHNSNVNNNCSNP